MIPILSVSLRNLASLHVCQLLSWILSKTLWFSSCRHQVLRIVAKDEVQLSLIKDLEDMSEFEVIYHPLTTILNNFYE